MEPEGGVSIVRRTLGRRVNNSELRIQNENSMKIYGNFMKIYVNSLKIYDVAIIRRTMGRGVNNSDPWQNGNFMKINFASYFRLLGGWMA